MRLPDNLDDKANVRILVSIDGSFQSNIELTGKELKKLARLVSTEVTSEKTQVFKEPELKAGDAVAEKRGDNPKTTVETRVGETRTVHTPTKTEQVDSTTAPESEHS